MPRFVIEVLIDFDLSIGSCFFPNKNPYANGEIMDYLNWCKSELIKGRILDIIFFENSGHSWLRQITFWNWVNFQGVIYFNFKMGSIQQDYRMILIVSAYNWIKTCIIQLTLFLDNFWILDIIFLLKTLCPYVYVTRVKKNPKVIRESSTSSHWRTWTYLQSSILYVHNFDGFLFLILNIKTNQCLSFPCYVANKFTKISWRGICVENFLRLKLFFFFRFCSKEVSSRIFDQLLCSRF